MPATCRARDAAFQKRRFPPKPPYTRLVEDTDARFLFSNTYYGHTAAAFHPRSRPRCAAVDKGRQHASIPPAPGFPSPGARGPVYERLEQLGAIFNYAEKRRQDVRTAVGDYYRQHGHLNVPNSFVTDDGIHLGMVIANTRRLYHKGKVPAEDVSWWESYTINWSPQEEIQEAIHHAVDGFYHQQGHLDVPADYVTENGVKLGAHIQTVRRKGNTSLLTPEEVAWWTPTT